MRLISLACLLLALPLATQADSLDTLKGRYRVDPSSTIRFSVAQMGGQSVEGLFRKFAGQFVLEGNAARSTVQFELAPASVQSVDPRVEDFIRSEAVFNVERYPRVTFRSTAVERTGEDSAVVTGRLTAKGVTSQTRFEIRYLGKAGRGLRFHVTGKMSRALFHMDVGTPIYSNMVVLDMDLIGRRD